MQKITLLNNLCKNCLNCKTKNKKVFCKEEYWKNQKDWEIFTPFDFDCGDFISMED